MGKVRYAMQFSYRGNAEGKFLDFGDGPLTFIDHAISCRHHEDNLEYDEDEDMDLDECDCTRVSCGCPKVACVPMDSLMISVGSVTRVVSTSDIRIFVGDNEVAAVTYEDSIGNHSRLPEPIRVPSGAKIRVKPLLPMHDPVVHMHFEECT